MTKQTLRDNAIAALARLAKSNIPKILAAAGIKGQPRKAECCPVSNWLGRELGVIVLASDECVVVEERGFDGAEVCVATPAAVGEFMDVFDAGGYPDLIGK